jgi:16S rRNA (guanine(966)-N(2))-methyltransferase RsmD
MRIIAGEFRNRKLISPPENAPTRPIPDRVKEALFNLLRGWTEGATVLDVFAGSGAIGFEAVSRGATSCTFFERDKRVADLLQRNIEHLGCADRCEVMRADALGPALLTRSPQGVDLMFFDPPYALVDEAEGWDRVKVQFGRAMGLMKDKSFAVLRTPWPFKHFVPDDAGEVAEGEHDQGRRRRKGKGSGRGPTPERVWEGADLRELEASGYDAEMLHDDDDEWEGEEEDGWDDEGEDAEHPEGAVTDEEHESEGSAPDAPPRPAGKWIPADLSIPGAKGPETHVYGSTAIHLYMPDRAGTTSGH